MPTIWKELEPEDRERLYQTIVAPYLHGSYYAFAIALSRGLSWPIVGLMKNGFYDGLRVFNSIWHAAVRDPRGRLWDVRGPVDEQEFGEVFDIIPPYDLKTVTERELVAIKRVTESEIDFASKMAQVLWPDLSWKIPSLRARVNVFAQELEILSRKHGIWIRGCFPASLPVLAEGLGDEKGYKLEPTADGLSYTINRAL